jgi:hypothetical protein
MSKIGSWVNNMTTWFQIKRDQDRAATKDHQNQHQQVDTPNADRLAKSILEIMHKPKGFTTDDEFGPKPPSKPGHKP